MENITLVDTISKSIKNFINGKSDSSTLLTPVHILIALVLGSFALYQNQSSSPSHSPNPPPPPLIDTFVPQGTTLLPIQVANYESLDQIIGPYGVVDLFSTPLTPNEKSKRIAYAVKLVRSPKNPRYFSVLVPEEQVHKLVGYHREFTVAVRNPKSIGTKFVKSKNVTKKRRIIYESEAL